MNESNDERIKALARETAEKIFDVAKANSGIEYNCIPQQEVDEMQPVIADAIRSALAEVDNALAKDFTCARSRINRLEYLLAQARETLEFYADMGQYVGGYKAREALKEIGVEQSMPEVSKCERCEGKGKIQSGVADVSPPIILWEKCPDCDGSGQTKTSSEQAETDRLNWMIATNCFVVRSRSVISPEQYIVVQGLDRDNVLGSGETPRAAIDNARGTDG